MSRGQRSAVYVIIGSLWLSGSLWLFLDQYCAKRGDFGITPHPLEAPLLLLHGVVAIISMYLLGWITARHVLRWWPARWRRLSGGTLAAFLVVLSASGFALFFLVDDASLRIAAVIHDAFGLAVAVFAIQHWFLKGRQRAVDSAPRPRG